MDDPELSRKYGDCIRAAYIHNPELREQCRHRQLEKYKNKNELKKLSKSIKLAYERNPKLRKKLSAVHKKLNAARPELGKAHSQRIRGNKHPRFNHTIYTFNNSNTSEAFIGTSYDFRKLYEFPQSKICLLVNRKIKRYKGWMVDKIPCDIEDLKKS